MTAGDKFIFQHSSRVTLHVSDPEAVKEIFCNVHEFGKCTDRALAFELVGSRGLGFAEQQEWATQRRVVRPAFFPDRSKVRSIDSNRSAQLCLLADQ